MDQTASKHEDELNKSQNLKNQKKKKVVRRQNQKLVINISHTKYYVVRYVAKKLFNMKLSSDESEDWDLQWVDTAVHSEKLYRMKPYQRVNHFPGMYALSRKNNLAMNLRRM